MYLADKAVQEALILASFLEHVGSLPKLLVHLSDHGLHLEHALRLETTRILLKVPHTLYLLGVTQLLLTLMEDVLA